MHMTIEQTEVDVLGAEALPAGLAEIQRALQPAPDTGAVATPQPERRDANRSGVAGRRASGGGRVTGRWKPRPGGGRRPAWGGAGLWRRPAYRIICAGPSACSGAPEPPHS